jgi:hypothetical protein
MMPAILPTRHRISAAKLGRDRLNIPERPIAAAVVELVKCARLRRERSVIDRIGMDALMQECSHGLLENQGQFRLMSLAKSYC